MRTQTNRQSKKQFKQKAINLKAVQTRCRVMMHKTAKPGFDVNPLCMGNNDNSSKSFLSEPIREDDMKTKQSNHRIIIMTIKASFESNIIILQWRHIQKK